MYSFRGFKSNIHPLMKFTVNSSGKGFDNLKNKVYVQESNGCE